MIKKSVIPSLNSDVCVSNFRVWFGELLHKIKYKNQK